MCTPEGRDSDDIFAKATYFLSTPRFGSHNLVFGYDNFNDIRTANNHQSGSDYRILSAGAILSGNGAGENDIFPIFLGDGTTTIQWNPILQESEGSNFRTHSGFVNDTWRVGSRLSANVGVRFDKNHGSDQSGNRRREGQRMEPAARRHLGSDGEGRVERDRQRGQVRRGNFQSGRRFVGGGRQPADSSVHLSRRQHQRPGHDDAGRRRRRRFARSSTGSSPTAVPTCRSTALRRSPASRHRSPTACRLRAPGNTPAACRVSSARAHRLRADLLIRHYVDFYMRQTDTTTGLVQDPTGRQFDLSLITNAPDGLLSRDYAGGTFTGTYRFGTKLDVGANYTLSRAHGNFDAENVASGPVPFDYRYPEYSRLRGTSRMVTSRLTSAIARDSGRTTTRASRRA